jgi:single-strand DNA-binding protein
MFQQISLIGNLGNDPELRYAPSGDAVCSFNVAVSRKWNDQSGQKQEKTTWFRISVWGKQAEPCATYLAKGRQVFVQGEIEAPRVYTDRDGNSRSSLEVKANSVQFLGQKGDTATEGEPVQKQAPVKNSNPVPEDVPF